LKTLKIELTISQKYGQLTQKRAIMRASKSGM